MRRALLAASLVAAGFSLAAAPIQAAAPVTVGGAPMYASKNIVENAVHSEDHTTLVAAVKEAGLVDTLASEGPFTVFAPTNAAFGKLPEGAVASLMEPENKEKLATVLTFHVVPGKFSAHELMSLVQATPDGVATVPTAAGEELRVAIAPNGELHVADAEGRTAVVTIPDVNQSNGVIHVVDTVLLP